MLEENNNPPELEMNKGREYKQTIRAVKLSLVSRGGEEGLAT